MPRNVTGLDIYKPDKQQISENKTYTDTDTEQLQVLRQQTTTTSRTAQVKNLTGKNNYMNEF